MLESMHVRTPADAKRIVEERNLTHVKIGLFDVDGVMRGKYLRKEKFFAALDKGLAFCDVVLGWDSMTSFTRVLEWNLPVGIRVTPMLPFESCLAVVATFRLNRECYFSSASSTVLLNHSVPEICFSVH